MTNISELEKEYRDLDDEIIQYKEAILNLVEYNRVPVTTLLHCLQVCIEEQTEIRCILRDLRKN